MDIVWFVAGVLATWRIAAMLYFEYGPWDIWLRMRAFLERSPFWNKQINCFWCCTLIAALVVWPLYVWLPWVLAPLAFSGAAVLLTQGGRIIWREMVENS